MSEEIAKVLARLLARMYDQGVGGAVKIATRGGREKKKESERENRKNATGRKYVVEIALCRGGVGDRPLLDRRSMFGRVLPLRAENVEALEGRMEKDGKGCRYNVYLPRMYSPRVHFRTARPAADRKNLPKFADRNRVLFGDLQLSDLPFSEVSLLLESCGFHG